MGIPGFFFFCFFLQYIYIVYLLTTLFVRSSSPLYFIWDSYWRISKVRKKIMPYLVECHGQSARDGETLTILEAALDGGEVADGQVP